MKSCLACRSEIVSVGWNCAACGWSPKIVGDIPCFAPALSDKGQSYDPAWYAELADLEDGNFWFVARNRLLLQLISSFLPDQGKYLEIGCGTGYVLSAIRRHKPDWRIAATEVEKEGLVFAQDRVDRSVEFCQMDACDIPYRNEFDMAGAFDVIEHINDEESALRELYQALKPGGFLVLSVPQHMFLWSKFDEIGCHFRRYEVGELEKKLEVLGFEIQRSTSFNALLLPLMILSRALNRHKDQDDVDVLDELRISPFLNKILSVVMLAENYLINIGIDLPLGGSRMIVARKTQN